jgi:hypothetical protein
MTPAADGFTRERMAACNRSRSRPSIAAIILVVGA